MARVLADLPDDDIEWLDRLARERGQSRASLLREAVSAYRAEQPLADTDWIDAAFGLWTRGGTVFDAEDYERKRRAEWTRYWDDDYEEVRAESPDMFDAEDDRQRQIYLDMLAAKYPDPKPAKAK